MNRNVSPAIVAAVGAVLLSTACGGSGTADPVGQPIAAVTSAARELDASTPTSHASDHDRVSYFESVFDQLRALPALAPLFDLYGIPMPTQYDQDGDVAGLQQMLGDVKITIKGGTVTITNRKTGGVIFSAPLSDLSSGVLHPENLPGGATTTPPPTCTAFTYSDWGTCTNGVQTRTVLTSSPSGCTGGAPILTQACTSAPATCTSFTYSAWSACANGTQSRTLLTSSPTGCTGGAPILTQACTSAPATCTSFTYSAWGACQPDGTQTRAVLTSSPSGCTGGAPVVSQSCTYVPPACTYTYSAWGACQPNGTQTRTVVSSSPAGCAGTPVLSQSCTYVAPNPVTFQDVVSSCTGCHGLTSNTTVFKSGGYTVSGRSAAQWLTTVNNMVNLGTRLAAGTTAQNYADYLAKAP